MRILREGQDRIGYPRKFRVRLVDIGGGALQIPQNLAVLSSHQAFTLDLIDNWWNWIKPVQF